MVGQGTRIGARRAQGSGSWWTLAVVASCAGLALGDVPWRSGDNAFQWAFDGDLSLPALNQCQSYKIIVQPSAQNQSVRGTPPFYMLAFTPGGVTTTSLLGEDPDNLQWTVNQPTGLQLMLTVADSLGYSGGQPASLLSVDTSKIGRCLPQSPSVNITVETNTTRVGTCQPIGLRLTGGQKPYNLTIAALNSSATTNVTLDLTDDTYAFVNSAHTNEPFLVAVSDATGTWGSSTPIIQTFDSGSGCGVTNGQDPPTTPNKPVEHHATTIILSTTIPLLCIMAFCVGGIWYKRRRNRLRNPGPAIIPEAWSDSLSVNENGNVGASGRGLVPTNSEKARILARVLSPSLFASAARNYGWIRHPAPEGDRRPMEGEPEPPTIIQHRDGGALSVGGEPSVQEVPPPYMFDRDCMDIQMGNSGVTETK